MSADETLGVYVLGGGRAGQARARALEALPGVRLAGVVSARGASDTAESASPDLTDALADDSADAWIVCTPNLLHASHVGQALDAGRHVAVEFPLAASRAQGAELLARAARAERVLHVEHIELLSPSQAALRERRAELGRLQDGRVDFRGRASGWIADPKLAGGLGLCALARLMRITDLFGRAVVLAADGERRADGWRLRVELAFAAGGRLELVEERSPDAQRATEWAVVCEGGTLETPPAAAASGLFQRDTEVFLDRVRGRAEPYVSDARVLEGLALADAIDAELGRSAAGAGR